MHVTDLNIGNLRTLNRTEKSLMFLEIKYESVAKKGYERL